MKNQSWLVLFLVVIVAFMHVCHSLPSDNEDKKDNDIAVDDDLKIKRDPKIPMAQDPRFNKMLPFPKIPDNQVETSTKAEKAQSKPSSVIKDETSTIGFVPYKDDKLDSDAALKDIEHADISKDDEIIDDGNYEDYYDEDNDEYLEDEENEDDGNDQDSETRTINVKKTKESNKTSDKYDDEELNEFDYTDDEEDDEEEEDMGTDLNKVNNEIKQCPRDCICERNMHSYFVATCSRLDLETQSFANLPITDLQVIDIGPQFPILLGVNFFSKIGLANVTSIKIANSSIEYISPSAFNGLNELYSVNLTSIGIDLIHPDTFSNNTKLKILTLSGNNLNVMQSLSSPYTDYMLKSPSIEELDISNCNMQEFLPTAFSQMKNIIYINLAGNKLTSLPQGLFDKTDTIEELDLSFNKIATLPKDIFNQTSLSILHLKFNKIVANLEFVTKDVQKLDLSYNKITNVNNQMFKGIENLSYLMLKGNKIKRIHPAAFVTLKNLRHIDLSFNDLDQINSLTFLKNPDLEVIRINDNIRLKTLPNEGFESSAKSFHVFLFDATNCDLSNLGENTFHTMPFITRLFLSGNNIDSIHKNLFSPMVRLMELDLSNNLLNTLDSQIFWNNQDLNKLNLAANPLESLSTKLFAPTPYLENLDISDCDLVTLWHDSSSKQRVGEFLKTLKFFNASNNDIKNIYSSDLSTMKALKVFDLKNNPLLCNDDFKDLMKFLGFNKISLGIHKVQSEFEDMKSAAYFEDEISPAAEWNELARKICKRNEENKLINEQVLDEIDDSEEEYDDETLDSNEKTTDSGEESDVDYESKEDTTKKPVSSTKAPKQKTSAKPKTTTFTTSAAPSVVDSDNKNYESEADDNYDYSEENSDENREDESIVDSDKKTEKDKNIFMNGVQIIKEIETRIIGGSTDEVIIEEASPHYRFLWPMLIAMLSIVILLLVIMNVIALCMRRRGERYRQALMRSKNNPIVYQKLSEEITPQTPKLHRYTPIQQV